MKSTLALLLTISLASFASADITWNVTYLDATTNIGFGTGNANGATRRSTFEAALDYISATFDTPMDVTLDYTVEVSETDGTGSLASAGTSFFGGVGYTNGVLFQHAQTGIDPTAGADGSAEFDFGYNWNNDNDLAAFNEFDLFTVALHEVTHSLGFLSLVSSAGESVFGGNPGTFSVLNSFLELGDGTDLFDGVGEYLGDPADLIGGDVFFNGANAVAANGGAPVKIYAPGTFAPGSSISHVDTGTFPNAVMTHSIADGVSKKEYSAIDIAILQDLGWSLKTSSIPEPGSAAMFGLGTALLFFRRPQRSRQK